jgi:hypothetical protein
MIVKGSVEVQAANEALLVGAPAEPSPFFHDQIINPFLSGNHFQRVIFLLGVSAS